MNTDKQMNPDTEEVRPLTSTDKAHYATDDDFNWDTWWGGYIDPSDE